MSFKFRIMLASAGAAVIALIAAAFAVYSPATNTLVSSLDNSLSHEAKSAVNAASAGSTISGDNFYGATVQFWPNNLSSAAHLPVTARVRAMSGQPLGTEWFTTVTVKGVPLRELVEPVPNGTQVSTNAGPIFLDSNSVMQLAIPLTGVDQQAKHLKDVLILVAAGGIILALLLGLLVARAVMVPLDNLTDTVERIAETTDVSERLEPGGSDELGRLRRAFNHLLGALDTSRESQRQLVLDASHELRTPLTSLRTNLEVVRRVDELTPADRNVLVDDVLTQMQELTDLVAGLAELARGEARPTEPELLRFDLLVEDAVGVASTFGRARTITFTTTAQPTWVRGHRDRLTRAVGNLLDNALKWSPDGAVVEVACAGGVVTVRDHGPGISPEDLPHIFDRFYRAAGARSLPGSGLGLAIVAQVMAAEGGAVDVLSSVGEGAIFRLTLPTALPPAEPAFPVAPPGAPPAAPQAATITGPAPTPTPAPTDPPMAADVPPAFTPAPSYAPPPSDDVLPSNEPASPSAPVGQPGSHDGEF